MFVAFQVFLIALKLEGALDWSWLWVFSVFPIIIVLIFLAVLAEIVASAIKEFLL